MRRLTFLVLLVFVLFSTSLGQGVSATGDVELPLEELELIAPVAVEYLFPFDDVGVLAAEDREVAQTLTLELLLQELGSVSSGRDLVETSGAAQVRVARTGKVYEKALAVWRDPLTLPRSRVKGCSEWAKIGTWKICVVPKVQTSWLERELVLEITYPDALNFDDVRTAVEQALRDGLVASAVVIAVGCATGVGCAGGFAAAELAFTVAFKTSIGSALADQLGINLENRSRGWTPWA